MTIKLRRRRSDEQAFIKKRACGLTGISLLATRSTMVLLTKNPPNIEYEMICKKEFK
jgi:hypothetical protein